MDDDPFVFSDRWWDLRGHAAEDQHRRQFLERELAREVTVGHALHGEQASAVAACQHCDDTLFEMSRDRYAVVHLSYPKSGPDRPPWPIANVFSDWAGVVRYLTEHQEL